jgi:hypothetical protein
MESDAVERITQDPALPGLGIKHGSNSEMIADGEESLLSFIPNHKRIIANYMVNEAASPNLIGLENHLRIGWRPETQIMGAESFRKLFPRVKADLAGQPSDAIDRARLAPPIRFRSRVKSSVHESDVFLGP